jgi:hypothetical protein
LSQGPDAIAAKLYAPLCQQLNLGASERKTLKDLVLKRTMAGVRGGMSLMNPSLSATKRAEVTLDIKSKTDEGNVLIKEFLGEENYAVFKQYEKTIPDRTLVDLFASRHAKTPAALNLEQQARLLQALSEARARYLWTTDLSRRTQETRNYATLFDEENFLIFAQEEEQFDRQFLTLARDILSPDQLAAFETFQATQRQSQIAQMKMTGKLLGIRGAKPAHD